MKKTIAPRQLHELPQQVFVYREIDDQSDDGGYLMVETDLFDIGPKEFVGTYKLVSVGLSKVTHELVKLK